MSLQPEHRSSSMLGSVGEKIRHDVARLLVLLRGTYAAFKDDGGRALSAALVYYSTLSIVPLLILIISLPGLLLRMVDPVAAERFVRQITDLVGPTFADILTTFLERVQNQSLLVAGVSIGMLLFSASSGFRFLRYAFRWIWRNEQLVPPTPSSLGRLRATLPGRIVDALIAFGIVFVAPLIATVGLIIYLLLSLARALLNDLPMIGSTLSSLLAPLILLFIYSLIFILLLWVMPPVLLRLRDIVVPGFVCAVAVLITTYGLGLYIRFFSGMSIYGAIGTIFALQLWTYINAIVLFSCAELTKLLVRNVAPT
ncbi:YihY/virulence factor BrkB family protein [Candidatus Chloroploca sp. M-50]|uniref:YihY/virulence factor BrkB family protein n=1 Tax=Candidatus Chloroploca mongolica TaxID=2528176 RepID=A0ABS4DBC3_9CHLR|nr:YihY/virulence factor BrkB family protein [Candidatus Chloroploca mongolica]MBP1466743.1 YihY/virulence factor BrkB family protein [Candidatus Chloroploca mongolica]